MACSSEHRFNEVNEHTRDKEELNAEITKELDAELDRVLEEALYDDLTAYLEIQTRVAFHDGNGDTTSWNNKNRNLWETETDEEEKEDYDFWEHDCSGHCVESESDLELQLESEASARSDDDIVLEEHCSPIADMDTLTQQFGDPSAHGHHSQVINLALMCEELSLSNTQLSSVDADMLLKDIYAR